MVWQRPAIPGPRGRTGATGPSGGGGGTVSTVSVTFPSERWVRQTVVDAAATATSKILLSVQAPAAASDVEDEGWMYGAQVVSRATGTFDVVAFAVPVWGDDAADNPSGTITLNYTVS